MATALDLSFDIDPKALGELDALMNRIAANVPQDLKSETRHAAILLCKSLRARTRVAPKRIPRREYMAAPVEYPPKYIRSNSAHHKLLHGWTLVRKVGTPDAYGKRYFVYTNAHRNKDGRMVGKDLAAERKELLEQHGGISRHGLAKKSWGWIMKKIYNASLAAGDLFYKAKKGERRDPRQAIDGRFIRTKSGAFAEILNSLDYIRAAMKPGALNESVVAAAKNLFHKVESKLMEAESGRGTSVAPSSFVSMSSKKWWGVRT